MFGSKSSLSIKRLLVIRFSAMGDAAMTVPVLHALASQHPDLRITMLTRKRFTPLFGWLPANVQVKGIDFASNDGLVGLTRLYQQLRKADYDAVADLHDVLRSKYLRGCFALAGTRVAVVDKGRRAKKELIGNGLRHEALPPMTERYADVFRTLGLPIDLSRMTALDLRKEDFSAVRSFAGRKQENEKWIGVAPFAAHLQKIYPLERMRQVVGTLAGQGYRIFLFGAGKKEADILTAWEEELGVRSEELGVRSVVCVCNRLGGLGNEMLLMSQLDLMISMDSANMHIASIFGTPVLSIWGATHPKAGFAGFGQSAESVVQLDLPCRPCSIYGKAPCALGDLRCMDIAPETIVKQALKMLSACTHTDS